VETANRRRASNISSLLLCLALLGQGANATPPPYAAKSPLDYAEPLPLDAVRYWAYQIQNIDSPGSIDSLANSHYDLVVIEPTRTDWSADTKFFDTPAMVDSLKRTLASDGIHRKLVVAYIDIGEAEDWRWYWTWSTDWTPGDPFPADWPGYIVAPDPDGWGGDFPVTYWDEDWKDLVIYGRNQDSSPHGEYTSIVDETIRSGFDGVYLDWVEGFENDSVIQAAAVAGVDPAAEMIQLIREIRDSARTRIPDFLVIQQNATALIDGHSELTSVIDAIAQEGIWFDGDATDDWNDPNGHDWPNEQDLIEYYLDYLSVYQSAGVPVFDCEYALGEAAGAYQNAYAEGFIPYCTRTSLSALTTTPPPGYAETSVRLVEDASTPRSFFVGQNFPNPFNAQTSISLRLPRGCPVELTVINTRGQTVDQRNLGTLGQGVYDLTWNGEDLPSGVYFYRIIACGEISTRKMVLLK
jgi:cysteinyl-tRNA synthetase